jgi:hypothetical protein
MASIKQAVEWIAVNDETGENDPETVATLISVCLTADLFDKTCEDIAARVLRHRRDIGLIGPEQDTGEAQ